MFQPFIFQGCKSLRCSSIPSASVIPCEVKVFRYTLGCPPHPSNTRITMFLVGDPYKPSFATVTGRGDNPRYTQNPVQNHDLQKGFGASWNFIIIHLPFFPTCQVRVVRFYVSLSSSFSSSFSSSSSSSPPCAGPQRRSCVCSVPRRTSTAIL